ncbi:MAG: hypothetical protein WC219_05565 [Acholeplasmataceae bacterium]
MMKWIGRSIYVLAIAFISVIVYRIAYTAKLQEYYEAEIKDNMDDDEILLKGLNTLLTIDYYREAPLLYQYISENGNYQFNLSAYAIGISYGDESYDGLMFVINDVQITEDDEIIDNPIIKMSVTLSHQTLLVNEAFTNYGSVYYDPVLPFSIYNVPALFLFDAENYLLIPNEDENAEKAYATIESITLEYSNGSTNDNGDYVFDEVPMFVGSKTEYRDAVHDDHKDITFNIDTEAYQLKDDFGSDGLTADDIETLNLVTDQDDLTPYNGAVWKIMIIYVLVVLMITYFLFFHKYVRIRMQRNQTIIAKEKQAQENKALFKDIEEDEK